MKIRWLGHASFLITAGDAVRWVTDPFDESTGYLMPPVEADYVTVSHSHFDHCYVQAVGGNPVVYDQRGDAHLGPFPVRSVLTYHDDLGGAHRGTNLAFVADLGGIRVCHLGDLGHVLNNLQRAELGRVDVLMIPVGGTYTIDAAAAAEVVKQLEPHVVIPMHYRTAALAFPLDGVERFLNRMRGGTRYPRATLEIAREGLQGPPQVYVLQYL
ncbi:MAG: MBL fold metallo-hydrolase [Bacillota bacterium]